MGFYVPQDLETELSLEEMFGEYSAGERHGRFTICNFTKPSKGFATISFEDVATLSGGGAELEYFFKSDGSVKYVGPVLTFRSLI